MKKYLIFFCFLVQKFDGLNSKSAPILDNHFYQHSGYFFPYTQLRTSRRSKIESYFEPLLRYSEPVRFNSISELEKGLFIKKININIPLELELN